MKTKLVLTLILLLAFKLNYGQQIILKHNGYVSYYNILKKEPDSVKWVISNPCLKGMPRLNIFKFDPLYKDTNFNIFYEGSGYDRGHQYDAEDASCYAINEEECWYFTNMVPQCPNLNRITWRALENYTRKLGKSTIVNVTSGQIGFLGYLIGVDKNKIKHPSKIVIPEHCWKTLYYNGKSETYIMPNVDTVSKHNFTFYKMIKKQ